MHTDTASRTDLDRLRQGEPLPPPWPLAPSSYEGPVPSHPAKWTPAILDVAASIVRASASGPPRLTGPVRVLDPFGGVGGIHRLEDEIDNVETIAVDIQPEWAAADQRTVVGDATQLPEPWTEQFDYVITSVTYPNRMTDSHEAKDACKACAGSGCKIPYPGCAGGHPDDGQEHGNCSTCKGTGLSRRNTYRHRLDEVGATVAEGSAVTFGWKSSRSRAEYVRLHLAFLAEAARVLRPYGRLLLNVSNHIEDGAEIPIVEWYLEQVLGQRRPDGPNVWTLDRIYPIGTPRNRQGANGDARADHEYLLAFHRRY